MKRLFEKYSSDLSGLCWLGLSIFFSLSLWSYSPTDPSFNSLVSHGSPANYCGYFGSFLADLLFQGFGITAWAMVLMCLRQSTMSLSGQKRRDVFTRWWLDGILLLCLCSLLTLHLGNSRFFGGQIRIGGLAGQLVVSYLVKAFNQVGLGIVLWTTFAGFVVLYTDKTWLELAHHPSKGLESVFYFFKNRWNWFKRSMSNRPRKAAAVAVPKIQRQEGQPLPKNFFPLNPKKQVMPEITDTAPKAQVDNSDAEDDFEDGDDLNAPISGFFKEESARPEGRRPKVIMKIPRRVENWHLPKISMLEDPPLHRARLDEREIKGKARLLVEKLAQFSVRGEVVGIKPGPAVTMFEFKPAADVKISKITELADDLALALSSESLRIIAPIPGRDVVGIETSNSQRESVFVKDIVSQEDFWSEDIRLPVAMGRKADGEPKIVDLRKMPHLLVAGSTGSGKSVFVVSFITGLLFRHSPKTLKLILVDPKQVDLAAFSELPHLVMPPIREAKKAVGALRWAIREMEKRYRSMSKFGARGLEAFNDLVDGLNQEQIGEHTKYHETLEGAFHPEAYYFNKLPYIVIVVEEFGDLMAVDKVNVEQAVVRLAQMARACGIHLVLAMQSPRKDVVTGLIKTNIPGRISFKVASKMDSRIILDESGAERLLARGDMLFLEPGIAKPERYHGPYLSEKEINRVVASWKEQGEPEYDAIAMRAIEGSGGGFDFEGSPDGGTSENGFGDEEYQDDRYDEILAYVASLKEVSASLLQRKFRLGYPRAARMIEHFETEGVVGPANGSKPRQVLVREMPK
jgi:S-DNA-T family DNA segregation ATPase FtsK/SpoIIIE